MKSYQIVFVDLDNLEEQLRKIKEDNPTIDSDKVFFSFTWARVSEELISRFSKIIEKVFPDAGYYGSEAFGNIVNGRVSYGISLICYILEEKDSSVEFVWVEKGSEIESLDDLWKYCKGKKGLRAVELNPTVAFVSEFALDNSVPDVAEEVVIFGGAGVSYDDKKIDEFVMSKGHSVSRSAMNAVLYFGEQFNVSTDYVLGWKGLGRYMNVTKSNDKIISEIDGMPAYSIYEKYLGLSDGDNDNLVFPLIVEEDGIEFIRTPKVFLPDKSMRMFANIPEGTLARIAYGDKNTILQSLFEKLSGISAFKPQVMKAYSCMARKLFWGEESDRETLPLQEIAPISGFYTGGEILRIGKKLRVMNSTLVVIGIREGDGSNQREKKVNSFDKNDKSLISRITHFVKVVSEEQQQALDVAEEEKIRNELLHEIIHSGKWSFFVNPDDDIYRADYSKEVRKIVNVSDDAPDRALSWIELIHPDDKDAAVSAFFTTLNDHSCNTPYDVTYRMIDKNNEYHWFHSAGRIVRDKRGYGEFFGIHINISEQIEKQLKQQKELEDALVMADSANHAKTEFLFNMSHDIRTPMNAILGFTNMAIKHVDDREKTLDCLTKTQQSGDLLLSLINNVLEVSRIEAGKAEIEEQPGDTYLSFIEIENTMRIVAEAKDINLSFEFGEIKNRFVFCDFNRCQRVFVNIISNAIKYTNEGGYVKVRCDEISSGREGYALFKYTFEDNGIGMSEDFQKHLFEQFSRERSVTKNGIQGTGLGMAVCKSYVELMGGKIYCKSQPGKGTTIFVELPFRIQEETTYVDPETKEIVTGIMPRVMKVTKDLKEKRILLTEDNELNREIAVEILEEKGLFVEEADDGTTAIQILKEKGIDYFDAILMDIQMPIMGGYEATRTIRKMFPEKRIPIIALSANAFAEDKKASMEAGMDEHVAKPINTDELFAVMSKYV